MRQLDTMNAVAVKQLKEWAEIIADWEAHNRYQILDGDGNAALEAGEARSSWLSRQFLKGRRPFTIEIRSGAETALIVRRPFRFYFHTAEIVLPSGRVLGSIDRQFHLFRRSYVVRDAAGREMSQLGGPFFRPWTFRIMERGKEVGVISKKWSGFGREVFTDADMFGVQFPPDAGAEYKAVLLGAVFLIDFVHFEMH